jgi:hypothetical protein
MEGHGPLGVPVTDLTPIARKAFEIQAVQYYRHTEFDMRSFYAQALRWLGNDQILIGVSAMTVGNMTFPDQGKREWNLAYRVDLLHGRVLRELSEQQLRAEYGIRVYQ